MSMIARVLARAIINSNGTRTIDKIPEKRKNEVKEALIELGYPELAEEK